MYQKICIFLIFVTFFRLKNATEVTIEQGTLAGAIFTSRSGRQFYAYLGIPFAKPPVDDLRFQPPQPPEPWNGVKNATIAPPMCIQNIAVLMGEEDCLYLNVYTPAEKSKTSSLPVMVYIHGGGFVFGGSILHNPKYFMDHDVIVVTIAYRLHILGFLSTGDDVVPGNNGMKDQVMALKWVQKNIAAFGGNPKQVTIFGNSAGGASVHYHMYSPLSKGLFHRGILQSGSALAIWAHAQSQLIRERVLALGTLLHCPTENSQKLVNCLRKLPAEELLRALNKFSMWGEPPIVFTIVSEPSTVKEAFINENPCYQDELNKVPWMVGLVPKEGLIITAGYYSDDGEKFQLFNERYKDICPVYLFFRNRAELTEDRTEEMVNAMRNFYFGTRNISYETGVELTNFFSDAFIAHDVIESAKRHTDIKYFYLYDHRNEISFAHLFGEPDDENLGVAHEDELISLFYVNGLFPEIDKGDDLKVSERSVKYWVNFATTGNPDPTGVWNPMKSDTIEYLHITTDKDEMKTGLWEDRYQFWKNLNFIPTKKP